LKKLITILMALIILTAYPSISESKETEENTMSLETILELNLNFLLPSEIGLDTNITDRVNFLTLGSLGITDYEVETISKILQMESGNQSNFGKRLVVYTIFNRLHNEQTWWGYDIESLVINPSQFNGVTNPRFGYYSEETYVTVLDAIYRYYSGELDEQYYGILYFNGLNKVDSRAYIDRYSLYLIVSEGGHRFYGEEK